MASPIHPNQFALQQEVLFRLWDDDRWREGAIQSVSVFDTKTDHGDGCDGYVYVIADHANDTLTREDRKKRVITECQCTVMMVDADSTGRWHGQTLGGGKGLALLLFDMERRNSHVALQGAINTDPSQSDRVMFMELPGYDHLASASLDDLVAWASGVPTSRWKEPTE